MDGSAGGDRSGMNAVAASVAFRSIMTSSFSIKKGSMIPFHRAKNRDFDIIRKVHSSKKLFAFFSLTVFRARGKLATFCFVENLPSPLRLEVLPTPRSMKVSVLDLQNKGESGCNVSHKSDSLDWENCLDKSWRKRA